MLLIAFGSVVAMGLPIITALMSLFVGAAGVGVLSAFMDVPEFSLILCMMVGLGVGIDYALFIVTRHRQHLHEGMSVEDSAGTANATAGQAVLFAGTTVVIAILGLFLAGLPAMTSMGVAVALTVVVAMLAAITLLPGLLGLAGTRIDKLSIHRKSHVAKPAHETFAGRWAHHVGSHPVRYAVVGLVALCAIAAPALSMRIGTPDDGNAPTDTTQRKAYDLLADAFGAGFNGPIQVVMEIPTPADRVAVDRVLDALEADPGVAAVTAPVFNRRRRHRIAGGQRHHSATRRAHRCTRPPPSLRRASSRGDGNRRHSAAHRSGDGHRPHRAHHEPSAPVHRSDRGDVVPAADARVPVDPRPSEGRIDEPALDRSCLRRDRRRVPVGLGQRADRGSPHHADQPVRSADDVRHPLRAVDGLRGVPAGPNP